MIEPSEHRPSQAIVDLGAIRHNLTIIQARMQPEQLLYATVKADAYGHGAIQVSKAALEAGADGLAVATVDEGIELRQAGIQDVPILILGLTDPRGIAEILHYHLTVTVSGTEFFEVAYQQLQRSGELALLDECTLNFHLALDTGMGRIGLRTKAEVRAFAEAINAFPWAQWEGVFTHFATAGGGPEAYIQTQWKQWQSLLQAVPDTVRYRHYANSAMALWYDQAIPSDIVRYGIGIYGVDPKDQLPEGDWPADLAVNQQDAFKPALSLISEIVHVKKVTKGSKISYGATYEAQEDEWIATISMGYADGWLRRYEVFPVLVDGQACPIVGRINMDQLMIRLPKQYPVGTTVTFIGQDGHLNNHVSYLAQQIDTIGYEILTTIGKRVPRIYLDEAGKVKE